MAESNDQVLNAVIARNGGAVLSIPIENKFRHMKSRFLGEEKDSSLWLETEENVAILLETAVRDGNRVGVVFRTATGKIMFATKILERRSRYSINSFASVPAVRVARPAELKAVQRRTNYRVRITAECELSVRAWILPKRFKLADKPPSEMELCIDALDLSAGGMSLLVKSRGDQSKDPIAKGQRLRILLHHERQEVLLGAHVRHSTDAPAGQRLGIQFVPPDDDLAKKQAMARLNSIVAFLARDEVRQLRLTS